MLGVVGALLLAGFGLYAQARLAGSAQARARTTDMVSSLPFFGSTPTPTPKPPPDSYPVAVQTPEVPNGVVAGACLAFNPTGVDLHHTFFIDPGHGGPDPGATAGSVQEKDLSLAVALQLKDQLRADGYRVVLARTADTSVAKLADSQVQNGVLTNSGVHLDALARIACANASHAEALVSIHFNAFNDPGVGGQETYYDDARDFAGDNLRLAKLLQSSLQASFNKAGWQVPDRGVLSDASTGNNGLTPEADAYGRLLELGPTKAGWNDHPTTMPGALVEPFFVSDPVEAQVASSPEGRRAIASGIEQALIGFASVPAPSPSAAAGG
ncbi:MAG: N-acetylmuramoyl-L-alanine amidase [Chloroflexi bacterium]|nr:MAG: N-acetylmuramoyl-L-alanine amidase [Chloroflexota bacterium]